METRTDLLGELHSLFQKRVEVLAEQAETAPAGLTAPSRKRRYRLSGKRSAGGGVSHHFQPRGTAVELLKYRGRQLVLSGPAGTGKSRACLEKMNLVLLFNPGARGLVVRKTLASLGSTGLVTWREKVAKEGIENGVLKFFGGSAEEPAAYRYSNGSTLVIGGMDKATKIMSSEYDIIFVQEATELFEDDWEALTTRLRNGVVSFQQLIGDCNPDKPSHWLKQRADIGSTKMLFSSHRDNPVLFDDDGNMTPFGEQYMGTLANLTGVRKLRLCDGVWAAADGLVYDLFDPALHIAEEMPEGWEKWERWWTVDFGYSNPFVCQFWAEDPDGGLWLYREVYKTKTLVEDHAKKILELVKDEDGVWKEPIPREIICDHDAEDRATLEKHLGMHTKPAKKTVKDGIQAVSSRFKTDERGKTRIHLLRDALAERDRKLSDVKLPCSTLEEISGYVWPSGVKPDQRENPVKENDHGMDAMRYMVSERDLGLQPRYRSFRY